MNQRLGGTTAFRPVQGQVRRSGALVVGRGPLPYELAGSRLANVHLRHRHLVRERREAREAHAPEEQHSNERGESAPPHSASPPAS